MFHLRNTTLLAILVATGCGGAGDTNDTPDPVTRCAASGDPCSPSVACCDGYSCTGGRCTAPTRCAANETVCGSSCCRSGDKCVDGHCQARTGARCGGPGDCQSGRCWTFANSDGGMCTEPCLSSASCSAIAAGMGCFSLPGGGALCGQSCGTSADCATFGADWSCNNAVLVEGTVRAVCNLWRSLVIGAQCRDNAQCASSLCSGWCTQACTSDAQCGSDARCIENSRGTRVCFPTCSSNSDCAIYDPGTTCVSATSVSNYATHVCSY